MATADKSPGLYIEEAPNLPASIAPVETAIPAFVGYTQIARDVVDDDLLLRPFRIASMAEYEEHFGFPEAEPFIEVRASESRDGDGKTTAFEFVVDPNESRLSKHIMHYALQMFFANGGGPCYIVPVARYKAVLLSELLAGLAELEKVDEPTLLVFPEAQALPIADFKTLHHDALAQCALLKDRFVIMDVHGDDLSLSDPGTDLLQAVKNFRDKGTDSDNLMYGAAYAPNLETIFDYVLDEARIAVVHSVNGSTPAAVMLSTLKDTHNRVYEGARAAIRKLPCKLPPSPAMAGIYAAVDHDRGVWRAPASVSINSVIRPTIEFTAREQDVMNIDPVAGKSVNAVRSFTGKGTLVWGARTLAGNDNEWRYISVRRFLIFVEESVKKATEAFVFESNDATAWVRIQAMCENFLMGMWGQGAIQGVKPEHAFYVAVGLGKTMTPLDLLEGRLIVEIGMAVMRPAEFIVLRFSHKLAQS